MFVFGYRLNIYQKMVLHFKHVRCKCISSLENGGVKGTVQLYMQKASEIFGCSAATARLFVNKNKKILQVDSANFVANMTFCKKHLKLSDVIEFPAIITLKTSLLQHRFFSLYELGFLNITATDIFRFSYYMKMTAKELQKQGVMLSDKEHIDCYVNFILRPKEEEENCFISRAQRMYYDSNSLLNIKRIMNAEFLSYKLDCPVDTVQQVFEKYPSLCSQSISNMDLLIDVLMQKFEFPVDKMLKKPFLLSLHHENLEVLCSCQKVLGIKLKDIAAKYPEILRKTPEEMQKIANILSDFNITDEQLMCCPKILLFSPNVLLERINILSNSPDFKLLRQYEKFLWLIYYYNNLNQRLEDLKKSCMSYSLNHFTVSKSQFTKYLWSKDCKFQLKDICFYLCQVFDRSQLDVGLKLQEYPYPTKTSLQNSIKVVDFLLNSGVSKEQMWNGLCVIFYDEENIRNYFNKLKFFPEFQPFSEWVHHYNLIQLLVYTMEVDAGFGGERIFKSTLRFHEPEKLNAVNYAI